MFLYFGETSTIKAGAREEWLIFKCGRTEVDRILWIEKRTKKSMIKDSVS